MVESNLASAEAYYNAMKAKDLEGMASWLHPTIRFIGPLAQLAGKEVVLEGAKSLFSLFNDLTIRAKFGAENQTIVVYDLSCVAPIGLLRVAALMTFDEGLISCIELFFDARPFEKK